MKKMNEPAELIEISERRRNWAVDNAWAPSPPTG